MSGDDEITITAVSADEIEADSPLALTEEGQALLAALAAPRWSEGRGEDRSVE